MNNARKGRKITSNFAICVQMRLVTNLYFCERIGIGKGMVILEAQQPTQENITEKPDCD